MFWKIFFELCTQNNLKPNSVAKKLGIASGTISKWKNEGSVPNCEILIKLANFFNVSVDYLLGRTCSVTETNSHNTISGNNNIIGNGNSVGEKLSEHESALIDIFKNLDVIKQAQLLSYAAELEKEG